MVISLGDELEELPVPEPGPEAEPGPERRAEPEGADDDEAKSDGLVLATASMAATKERSQKMANSWEKKEVPDSPGPGLSWRIFVVW